MVVSASNLGSKSKGGTVQFLNCLHKVQLNYPEITDPFPPRIFFLFQKLLGEERTLALEILAGRAQFIPELFKELQGVNFLGCLKHKYAA